MNKAQRIAALEAELAVLKAEPAQPEPWKPANGEQYWFVHMSQGRFVVGSHPWDNDGIDRAHLDSGNCFPTKELAQHYANRLGFLPKGEPEFEDGQEVWILYFCGSGYYEDAWRDDLGRRALFRFGLIHGSKEAAEAALKVLKEEFCR